MVIPMELRRARVVHWKSGLRNISYIWGKEVTVRCPSSAVKAIARALPVFVWTLSLVAVLSSHVLFSLLVSVLRRDLRNDVGTWRFIEI